MTNGRNSANFRVGLTPNSRCDNMQGTVGYAEFYEEWEEWEEWVDKAEQDVRAAFRLLRTCPVEVPYVICWLCLQCAEKYLKAFMTKRPDLGFIRDHDLIKLNNECIKGAAKFCELEDDLYELYEHGKPNVRYPGLVRDSKDAREAFHIAMHVRRFVRRRLWSKPHPHSILRKDGSDAIT